MADIPNKTIVCGVEYVVQSYGQFDYTETGSEMSTIFGDYADNTSPDFLSQIKELLMRQVFELTRGFDLRKQPLSPRFVFQFSTLPLYCKTGPIIANY